MIIITIQNQPISIPFLQSTSENKHKVKKIQSKEH